MCGVYAVCVREEKNGRFHSEAGVREVERELETDEQRKRCLSPLLVGRVILSISRHCVKVEMSRPHNWTL